MGQLSRSPNLQGQGQMQQNAVGPGLSMPNNGNMISIQGTNSIAQSNLSNMIITNSSGGQGMVPPGGMPGNPMMGPGGMVQNTLKPQMNAGGGAIHHGQNQQMQNGPMMGQRIMGQSTHMVRGGHLMGQGGPRMQTPNLSQQIGQMGGPAGPNPYNFGNAGQVGQQNVNSIGGMPGQQHMMVGPGTHQQRVPANMVGMPGNRVGGPIGPNIGLGNVVSGNDVVTNANVVGGLSVGVPQNPSQQMNPQLNQQQLMGQRPPQAANVATNPSQPGQQIVNMQQNAGGAPGAVGVVTGQSQQAHANSAGGGDQQASGSNMTAERRRQIQQQLVLLLHAHKCNRRESENPNQTRCTITYCKPMKDVLAHMANCKGSRDCTIQHCSSSRQILMHYKSCTKSDCMICQPFRQKPDQQFRAGQPNQPQAGPSGLVNNNINIVGAVPNVNVAMPSKPGDLVQQQQGQRPGAPNLLPSGQPVTAVNNLQRPGPSRVLPGQNVPNQTQQQQKPNIPMMGMGSPDNVQQNQMGINSVQQVSFFLHIYYRTR